MTANDPFNLQRFVDAQAPIYEQVQAELRAGSKTSHWMWFIFPQIEGLGQSYMARVFAISGRDEAVAYLQHPVLGPRLRECTRLVNDVEGRSITQILGGIDAIKFRSSMTLFVKAAEDNEAFQRALKKYYNGAMDELTLAKL
jgi:uncharacterized protein (DUF1810 family)